MGFIRSFTNSDVSQVARIHRAALTAGRSTDGEPDYEAYIRAVFVDNPWRGSGLSSLVYHEDDGRIVGFLGVITRAMTMSGRRFVTAISSRCVMDPHSHGDRVAMQLSKAFLDGPQELSIADEADDRARMIWEGLGGTTALLHSLHWTLPLRPVKHALFMLRNRLAMSPAMSPVTGAAAPLAPMIAALAARLPHERPASPTMDVSCTDDLSAEHARSCLRALTQDEALYMEYDDDTFRWLLDQARRRNAGGTLCAAVVRKRQRIIGCYLFHLNRDRIANVLQLIAGPSAAADVLDQLFSQASRRGAIAVAGRIEPRYLQDLSDKQALFHRRGPWVLLKSRMPELLRSFEAGNAFLSRLDGEWCLGF